MPLPTISDAHVNFIKTKRIYIKIDMLHPLLDHTLLSNLSVYFVNISMNAWMHETCHSFSLSYEWWFSIKKRHILPTIHFPIAFVSLHFFFFYVERVFGACIRLLFLGRMNDSKWKQITKSIEFKRECMLQTTSLKWFICWKSYCFTQLTQEYHNNQRQFQHQFDE